MGFCYSGGRKEARLMAELKPRYGKEDKPMKKANLPDLKASSGNVTLNDQNYTALYSYVLIKPAGSFNKSGELLIGEILSAGHNGCTYVRPNDLVVYEASGAKLFDQDIYFLPYSKIIATAPGIKNQKLHLEDFLDIDLNSGRTIT
jgi:hypothetical protein